MQRPDSGLVSWQFQKKDLFDTFTSVLDILSPDFVNKDSHISHTRQY